MAEPATQNPYMYCRGNPIKWSDPSGYWGEGGPFGPDDNPPVNRSKHIEPPAPQEGVMETSVEHFFGGTLTITGIIRSGIGVLFAKKAVETSVLQGVSSNGVKLLQQELSQVPGYQKAVAYGSRVARNAGPSSDLDIILVQKGQTMSNEAITALESRLGSGTGVKVHMQVMSEEHYLKYWKDIPNSLSINGIK